MSFEERLENLSELLLCGNPVYTWLYDNAGQLLQSNCPDETILGSAFNTFGCKDDMLKVMGQKHGPVVLGIPIGMIWMADYLPGEGGIERIVTIGPVFSTGASQDSIRQIFYELLRNREYEISIAWQNKLMDALKNVSTVTSMLMNQYGLMLHQCLTGERLHVSDINYYTQTGDLLPVNIAGVKKKQV